METSLAAEIPQQNRGRMTDRPSSSVLIWGLRPQTPCTVTRGGREPAPFRWLTRAARSPSLMGSVQVSDSAREPVMHLPDTQSRNTELENPADQHFFWRTEDGTQDCS